KLNNQLFYSHNFGHNGPHDFHGVGINAKMSELQAAMGLCVLPYMDEILRYRKQIVEFYDNYLDFNTVTKLKIRESTSWNYSYYPVIFENEEKLLEVQKVLNENSIFPRRYFYPSLNQLNYVDCNHLPVSETIAG